MTTAEARAVARIAARTARRNWKRTLLIVALIALPVATAQIAAGMVKAGHVAPEEWATAAFGQGDAEISMYWGNPAVADWVEARIAAHAPNASVLEYRWLYGRIGADRERFTEITDLDITAPLASGKLALTSGRLPANTGEAAISESDATVFDVAIGDEVAIAPDGRSARTYRVVGTVRDVLYLDRSAVIVAPDGMDRILAEAPDLANVPQEQRWLLGGGFEPAGLGQAIVAAWERDRVAFWPAPAVSPRPPALASLPDDLYVLLSADQVQELVELATSGASTEELMDAGYAGVDYTTVPELAFVGFQSRADYLYYEPLSDNLVRQPIVVGTLVAGLLLAEVALVAAAAYATGARRRLRELGLMSANGATTSHLRWSVVGEGLVAGVIGAATGSLIALIAFTAGRDIIQRFIDRLVLGVPLDAVEFAGPALAGAAAATIAAWLPARSISTVPALTALQGRIPLGHPKRWVVPLGIALTVAGGFLVTVARTASGGAATIQATGGVIIMITGFALLSGPMVAAVGRHADRFPPLLRLVLRDSARQRTRAAAAIAATMVVLTGPVVLGTALRSEAERQLIWGLPASEHHVLVFDQGSYSWADEVDESAVAAIAEHLPGSRHATLHVFTAAGSLAAVAPPTSDALESSTLGVALGTTELVDALGIPDITRALDAGPVLLGIARGERDVVIDGAPFRALEFPLGVTYTMPRLLVSMEFAATAGLEPAGVGTLLVTAEPLTEKLRHTITGSSEATVEVAWPPAFTMNELLWLGMGAAVLVVLLIVGLVTALAATESDRDMRSMVAIGAPPRLRRRFLGAQTAYYTAFAAFLAAPLALLLLRVATGDDWIDIGPMGAAPSDLLVIPWDIIAMVVVGLPVIVGAVTAVTVRSSPTAPPRRVG